MKDSFRRLVVLSSGLGSNLKSIINSVHGKDGIIISAVVSDKPSHSLKIAIQSGITCLFLPQQEKQSNISYNNFLYEFIKPFDPDFIVMAGFMRLLSSKFIGHYLNRIINIHPSLLPKYKGLNTHQRVLENDEKVHGTTIHFVNQSLDAGQIIAQKSIKISQIDTAESLKRKIKDIENVFYPKIIKQLCKDKNEINFNRK